MDPADRVPAAVGRPTRRALAELRRADPRLARAMDALPSFPGFPDATGRRDASHWEALARAIVHQQLSMAAARTIHARVARLGDGRFPAAKRVLELPDAELRGAGLSRAKVEALRDLARRSLDGQLRLRGLSRLPDEVVVERIVQVRGLGAWSAQMFLLFRLGRLDVAPAGDLGVREGLRLLDGLRSRPTPRQALERMECWRPLRSVGAWTMWRLVEAERAVVKKN
jgi:3-methyladenine DNA glycosylase/8-oxoguanine DNA glycosylase